MFSSFHWLGMDRRTVNPKNTKVKESHVLGVYHASHVMSTLGHYKNLDDVVSR